MPRTAGGVGTWYGEQQPFENVDRCSERMIRKRFDRELLLEYLAAVGISADDEDFYGCGVLVAQVVSYKRVQRTADQVRQELGW